MTTPIWGLWGYKGILTKIYYQNKFRNELPDYTNIGIDTLIELIGAISWILCCFASEILKSVKV